jgi:hypothetical protein
MDFVGDEISTIHQIFQVYKNGFAFSLMNLGSLKGHEFWIALVNNTPIF